MKILDSAVETFQEVFGEKPVAAGIAPGRVEVLGNHTDYNEGFILSAAIDRHIAIVGRPTAGSTVRVYAAAFKGGASFSLENPERTREPFWINYVAGVVSELRAAGLPVCGFEALIDGDVPLGAGLSSSAALEVATAMMLRVLAPHPTGEVAIARLCQAAENRFVGVNCGILDQFSSVMGKADHLVYLDCRDLGKFDRFALGEGLALVLANTNARHELADGTYNRLREDCFTAAKHFAAALPGRKITHLRDVTPEDLAAHGAGLPETTLRRARHVVTENDRVLRGVAALKAGDPGTLGRMMLGSHASSRDDFGNSCAELDAMIECARDLPGCRGARLSGGGFGGCTVNLVDAPAAGAFAAELARRYQAKTGLRPEMHICRAVDGARGMSL